MSKSTDKGNDSSSDQSIKEQSASELYQSFIQHRSVSGGTDKAIHLLEQEGLFDSAEVNSRIGGSSATNDVSGAQELEYVNEVYQAYRASRTSYDSNAIDSVMVLIEQSEQSEVEGVSLESSTTQATSSLKSSIAKVFNFPGIALTTLADFTNPKIAKPALAFAVCAIAVTPFILRTSSQENTLIDSEAIAYSIPSSVLTNEGVASFINVDPGQSAAMSGSNDLWARYFSLGARLAEVQFLRATTDAQSITRVVAAKISELSNEFENRDLQVSVASLGALLLTVPFSQAEFNSELGNMENILKGDETKLTHSALNWIAFGKAIESVKISERLSSSKDPFATGDLSQLQDALAAFNSVNFADNLTNLSESGKQHLTDIGNINLVGSSAYEERARLRALLQSLTLIVS